MRHITEEFIRVTLMHPGIGFTLTSDGTLELNAASTHSGALELQSGTVKVTATYHTPKIFSYLGIPETYELHSEAVVSVSDQDEFIRNIDFMHDLLDELGVLDFVQNKLDKMKSFISKIFGG